MSFQPVIPFAGYTGWSFLTRTREAQQAAFEQSPTMRRDLAYFEENIARATTAEALVSDRRLLSVALGAFGLSNDLENRYFIRKVLEDGTRGNDALANRLADKRYHKLSRAFGYGDLAVPNTARSDFPEKIAAMYQNRRFEVAVGRKAPDMRLALNLTRELGPLATDDSSDTTKWFTVMGSGPLRKVFETALGLPSSFGALDIDKQVGVFRDKAARAFGDGTIAQFADPARQEKLVRLFLVRSQIADGSGSLDSAATALALLQNAAR